MSPLPGSALEIGRKLGSTNPEPKKIASRSRKENKEKDTEKQGGLALVWTEGTEHPNDSLASRVQIPRKEHPCPRCAILFASPSGLSLIKEMRTKEDSDKQKDVGS